MIADCMGVVTAYSQGTSIGADVLY